MIRPTILLVAAMSVIAAARPKTGLAQWRSEVRPASLGTSNTGFMPGLRAAYWQPGARAGFDRFELSSEAGVGIRGSWLAAATAAGRTSDWHWGVRLSGRRDARFEFFGLGNDAIHDPAAVTDAAPDFYRVHRRRYAGHATVGRRLAGPVSLVGIAGVAHAEFAAVDGESRFAADVGRFSLSTDAHLGAMLVLDTRDHPRDPARGVFAEAGFLHGTAAGGYGRLNAVARGYVPLARGTVLAWRVGGSARVSGSLPLDARLNVPLVEGDLLVLGGRDSFRGLRSQRLIGDGVLWTNADLRMHLARVRGREVRLLLFADAGRVFEREGFGLGGFRLGGGAGLALPAERTVPVVQVGFGPDGAVVSGGLRWQF